MDMSNIDSEFLSRRLFIGQFGARRGLIGGGAEAGILAELGARVGGVAHRRR